jgi:beta-lactamase class A
MISSIRHASAPRLVTGIAIAGVAVAMLAAPAAAAPATQFAAAAPQANSICSSATDPRLAAHMSHGILAALNGRSSVVGLTVADPQYHLICNFHASRHFDAASVIKATIISALLLKVGGPTHLTKNQRHLAWLMITESDNDAATALWDEVGPRHMQEFLNRAGMRQTVLNYAWGLTSLTAHDEMLLLRLLTTSGKVLSAKSRGYVLWLMANVVSYERWGVSAGAPANVTVHLKNGWLPYPNARDWHINSIGAFTGHQIGYQIAILTSGNPGESYGIQTVQAAAYVINKLLAAERGSSASEPALPGKASLMAPGG